MERWECFRIIPHFQQRHCAHCVRKGWVSAHDGAFCGTEIESGCILMIGSSLAIADGCVDKSAIVSGGCIACHTCRPSSLSSAFGGYPCNQRAYDDGGVLENAATETCSVVELGSETF